MKLGCNLLGVYIITDALFCFEDAANHIRSIWQVAVGAKVWIADTLNPNAKVATGTVMSLAGQGQFHNRPIPPGFVRVTLEKVDVNIPLMIPVEDAEQVNLEDALGSSVLWLKGLTFPR